MVSKGEDDLCSRSQFAELDQQVQIGTESPPLSMQAFEQITRSRTIGGCVADNSEDKQEEEITVNYITPAAVADLPTTATQNDAHKIQHPPTKVTQSVLAPKARLPHDMTGLLEDRIQEDPYGDLEAWLSLISEHKRRNKIDDARAVYERFFKVFPTAVSLLPIYSGHH